MKFTFALVLLLLVSNLKTFTEEVNLLLQSSVKNGQVDYAAIKQNDNQIDQLYQEIGEMSLQDASEDEKKAFYINAYNLITIYQVKENYPLKSPMDVKGFFDEKKHTVAGESLTLNALEKEKLLKPYQDPRVHFVLVCAAQSCPPLASTAYRADQLDKQLEEKTRQALNNPQYTRVDKAAKKVEVSKIFDWYQDDFTRNNPSVLAYINQYRSKPIPQDYTVDYYEYDWKLNNQ